MASAHRRPSLRPSRAASVPVRLLPSTGSSVPHSKVKERSKTKLPNSQSTSSEAAIVAKQVENAVQQARADILGVATEANEAMKRVVAQTSNVEAFIQKHENETRRLRAEQEYRHLKELKQMQRVIQAHKTKSLLEEQKQNKAHLDDIELLERTVAEDRAAFEKARKELLDELKQTRQEKETAQMLAQRLSEKQTKMRMQEAKERRERSKDRDNSVDTGDSNIGNFVGKGGVLTSFSVQMDRRVEMEAETSDHGIEDVRPNLENSLEILQARTPNVLGYATSDTGSEFTMATSQPTTANESLQTPGQLVAAAGLGQVPPASSSSAGSSAIEWQHHQFRSIHSNPDPVRERSQSTEWENDSTQQQQQHQGLLGMHLSDNQKKLEQEQKHVVHSVEALQDKYGELDFGSKNNRRLISAINERFSKEVESLKNVVSVIPNVNAMELQLKQLIGVVNQIQAQSSEVLNLKSENALLATELKRRQVDSKGRPVAYGSSPLNKPRRVMQLASSQSDPNFTLPGLFQLGK